MVGTQARLVDLPENHIQTIMTDETTDFPDLNTFETTNLEPEVKSILMKNFGHQKEDKTEDTAEPTSRFWNSDDTSVPDTDALFSIGREAPVVFSDIEAENNEELKILFKSSPYSTKGIKTSTVKHHRPSVSNFSFFFIYFLYYRRIYSNITFLILQMSNIYY